MSFQVNATTDAAAIRHSFESVAATVRKAKELSREGYTVIVADRSDGTTYRLGEIPTLVEKVEGVRGRRAPSSAGRDMAAPQP